MALLGMHQVMAQPVMVLHYKIPKRKPQGFCVGNEQDK
jgi:hypothetical protein